MNKPTLPALTHLAALALVATLAACGASTTDSTDTTGGGGSGGGGTSGVDGTSGTVVQTFTKTLGEGASTSSSPLPAGTYIAVVNRTTGSGEGVTVAWSNTACPSSSQTKAYLNLCTVPEGGKLTITNPTDPWWVGDETVSVTIRQVTAGSVLAAGVAVVNETQLIKEQTETLAAYSRTYTLAAGSYQVTATGSLAGVRVDWSGASTCPTYSQSKFFYGACTLPSGGSVTVVNPNSTWDGDETATLLIKTTSSDAIAAGTVVADETQLIRETNTSETAEARVYTLKPGTYKAEISGVTHGVDIAWSQSSCIGLENGVPSSAYTCTLTTRGTLTVTNPNASWEGNETVTIKITKTN